jgi:hypothetical protein
LPHGRFQKAIFKTVTLAVALRRHIMLVDRIVGAFTFRKGVYAEVENDPTFTTTAWILVAVVAFLNQLGARAGGSFLNWLLGAVIGTVFAVIGFALGAFVINWLGRTLFDAEVTFEELVRTLGLAYVWQAVGLIGILGFVPMLSCLLAPIMIIAAILLIMAWFIAAKEALDLEWGQTILTVVVGWIVLMFISATAGLVLGMLGLGAAAIGGLF